MDARMLRIAADLLTSKENQRRFDRDPTEFMDQYGLSNEERALLYTCCKPLVAEAIRREIDAWELDIEAHYPGPEPHVSEVAPDSAIAGDRIPLVIRGEGIMRTASVTLAHPTGSHRIQCSVRSIAGTFRSTVIEAEADFTDAPAGDYTLEIRNWDHVPYLDEMDPRPSRKEWPGVPPLVNYFPFTVQSRS